MIYRLNNEYIVRALDMQDIAQDYPSWFSDQEVCKYSSHGKFPKTIDYFQNYVSGLNSETQIVWAIAHEVDGHIGNISLQNISAINQNAEFAIILGNRLHWGKGVAYLAGMKLLEHGFNKINLRRIYCGTGAENLAMRKLATKLGMTEEGCRRDHLYIDGGWMDVCEFGILKSEFALQSKQIAKK